MRELPDPSLLVPMRFTESEVGIVMLPIAPAGERVLLETNAGVVALDTTDAGVAWLLRLEALAEG